MVMVALCVLGLFSYAQLGVEQMPDIAPPARSIDVRYPGASPEAVEREITKPIEEALNAHRRRQAHHARAASKAAARPASSSRSTPT